LGYIAIELPGLGGDHGMARAINARGDIVGTSHVDGLPVAVLWRNGEIVDLGIGIGSRALDINDHGGIVGRYQIDGEQHGFLYKDGRVTDLGSFEPTAINNSGVIAGTGTSAGEAHAMLWHRGVVTDLGTLGSSSNATDVNNMGQVVGSSLLLDGQRRAFLWEKGTMTDIGTLGGNYSSANAINDRGQIIGGSSTTSVPGLAYSHAFLWERGEMTDLGTGQGPYSVGNGISNTGTVVGEGFISGTTFNRAFVDLGIGPVELPTVYGQWAFAIDVNEPGLVVGWETYLDGVDLFTRPVVWIRR
jgi:probable HAF family extracellular repeat protein